MEKTMKIYIKENDEELFNIVANDNIILDCLSFKEVCELTLGEIMELASADV